uniref:VWA domain-containing protein n=1 Tax=Haloterrigena alkaliphila TaxID=2816475 RepID=A0A8A2VG66_9EURY
MTIDGGESRSVNLSASPLAGGTASGVTLIELDSTLDDRTVTVSAASTRDPDRTVEGTLTLSVDEDEVARPRPDPDEYREVSVSDPESGATVDVGGDGLHEGDISVTNRTPDTDPEYRAGPVVHIENRRPIDRATVRIPLDAGIDPNDENLTVVKWDPHDNETWRPVETTIDADEGVAIAEVESFSYFSIFLSDSNEPDNRGLCYTSPGCDILTLKDEHLVTGGGDDGAGDPQQTDFVFVMDESGSMSGSPIYYSRLAAKRFVDALLDGDRAGLVGYDSNANLLQELTRDHDSLNASIESLSAGGGTHTEAGLRTGLQHLEANGMENRSQVMLLLSDGKSNYGSYPRRVAEDAADRGIQISTVGLGNSIDEDELRSIADSTGGDYYHVADEKDLPETFERVAENESEPILKDTSDDGIPDAVADANLYVPDPRGGGIVDMPLSINPDVRDTSGDGLPDNEQVDTDYTVYQDDGEWKLRATVDEYHARPSKADTDGDTLTDYEERRLWGTNPLRMDTSSDGFIDPIDPYPTEDSSPPEVRLSSADFTEGVLVAVDDKSAIESVEGNPYYDPPWPADSTWDSSQATTYDLDDELGDIEKWVYKNLGMVRDDDDYSIEFDTHWGTSPEKYYVNVTDEYDNEVSFLVEVDANGAELAKAGVVAGGTVSMPVDGPTAPASAVVGILTLVGSGTILIASEQGYFGSSSQVEEVPVDDIHQSTERTWETNDGTEIALPTGEIHEQSYYTDHVRGYGWEYIQETTSLTQTALGYAILTQDEVIYENGEIRYIIGGQIGSDEKVILSIIGGTVMAASHTPAYNDDCGATIDINQHDNPEHSLRDGKPIDEVSTLIEILENPTRIVDAGHKRYYILKLGTNRVVMLSTKLVSDAYQVLRTALTGNGPDNAFKTIDTAMDEIRDTHGDDYEIIHDPENGVEC